MSYSSSGMFWTGKSVPSVLPSSVLKNNVHSILINFDDVEG